MSMNTYVVADYGIPMSKELLKSMSMQICSDYSEAEYEENPWDFNDKLYQSGIIEYEGEFTGNSVRIKPDGSDDFSCNVEEYDCVPLYYIPLRNPASLFKAAYSGMDEAVAELEARVGQYLPDDFDYRAHICHIVGTYFG